MVPAASTIGALTIHADGDLDVAQREPLRGSAARGRVDELRDEREIHHRGLGVQQVGDQAHTEELPCRVIPQRARLEESGSAGAQGLPREPCEIEHARSLEPDIEPRDHDEHNRQPQVRHRQVDQGPRRGTGQRAEAGGPALRGAARHEVDHVRAGCHHDDEGGDRHPARSGQRHPAAQHPAAQHSAAGRNC